MNTVEIISEINKLPITEQNRVLEWLEKRAAQNGIANGIEKTSNVMNNAARIEKTRIAVWMLEQARRLNVSDADLLRNYPSLTAHDLANAWDYVANNREEIETAIADNELDDSSASLRWLDENRTEYLGEWIALDGNRLIAHGDNAKVVYAAARAAGVRVPFVELVTEIEKAPFCGGWE